MIKTFRFALLACGLVGGALTATAAPAVPVRVATVELAPHAEERAIPGRVEAIRAVDIRARTEGVIVQRHFQDGQYVTEGDLLFTLDDAQPRAALALAQAELKSAEASLRQSQQLLTRYERLINNHSISRNDVDTARMQRDVAAAAVQQDPQGFFSWVLKPDHTAGQRRLTLAGQQGKQFAVEKGLQAGEQVITDGAQRLREGAAVQVLN